MLYAVRGELGKENVSPAFTKQEADVHYTTTYSNSIETDFSKLNWMPGVHVSPESPGFKPFNMEPIRPRDVREALKNSNQKSSLGPDGVTFEMLHQLSALHKPLATLFNKVLQNGTPPVTWGESIIKLCHKKGPASDPTNF